MVEIKHHIKMIFIFKLLFQVIHIWILLHHLQNLELAKLFLKLLLVFNPLFSVLFDTDNLA